MDRTETVVTWRVARLEAARAFKQVGPHLHQHRVVAGGVGGGLGQGVAAHPGQLRGPHVVSVVQLANTHGHQHRQPPGRRRRAVQVAPKMRSEGK